MNPDPSNTIFQKAVAFVNQTNKHLFITGKAGTGKTTFLKYIKENTFKKMAVVAPTGVAAINAGGVTIHSFFQLPFGAFIPTQQYQYNSYSGGVNTPASLIRNLRLPSAKRTLIRELDLLVIDEVSMVRADLLDAIDTVMRHIRRQPLIPFGGVQLIYIGDLFQLPPVVKNDELDILKSVYSSPFFFNAEVIKQALPLYIELKKIYRQKDETFIHILNNIRSNSCTSSDLDRLHQYYKPGYTPKKEEHYITLTSHNGKADNMNQTELQNLQSKQFSYAATIKGEFSDRAYPADKTLDLKVGAQVMFIKNDKGEARRFYNGKIGTVTKLSTDLLKVAFAGETNDLEVEKETWKNIRYKYQQDNDHVHEEELGTFSQYPLRLAWAITIHKSQGLTFEKAIIDAGASFAPGQVYVSLSRLTSLDGLILYSRILPHTISTDQRVIDFVRNEKNENELQKTLEAEQTTFARNTLLRGFEFGKLVDMVDDHFSGYETRKIPEKNLCIEWCSALMEQVKILHEVSIKLRQVLEQLALSNLHDNNKKINERVSAAAAYFVKEVDEKLIALVSSHILTTDGKQKTKKYRAELKLLAAAFENKKQQINQTLQLSGIMAAEAPITEVMQAVDDQYKSKVGDVPSTQMQPKVKKVVGETRRLSLQLFKQGKSIEDIAIEREFSIGTIEGHLASFITTGEVDILDLVENDKLEMILTVVKEVTVGENDPLSATTLKAKLPDDVTYGQIRAALKFREMQDVASQASC